MGEYINVLGCVLASQHCRYRALLLLHPSSVCPYVHFLSHQMVMYFSISNIITQYSPHLQIRKELVATH